MDIMEKLPSEKRLIDANTLISYMDECSKESRFRVYYGYAKSFIDDAPTVDAVPVRHGPCPYCDAKTNDFIPLNQAVECSGIEIALNRQGMLRVRVYESGQETFTTQDIVEIKYCPNCGAKMGGDSHD